MWWFKSCAGAALLLTLASCGFTPLYGSAAPRPEVFVASIPDRDGQELRNLLIDRIYAHGVPQAAPYELRIEPLKISAADLGIQKDATVTRTEIEIGAHMTLVDTKTGATVLERHLRAVGGYDVLDEQYATLVTRRSVTDRVLAELADNVVTELSLYFSK
jgi:LPS-assembly lipoprotein